MLSVLVLMPDCLNGERPLEQQQHTHSPFSILYPLCFLPHGLTPCVLHATATPAAQIH